MVIFVVKLGFLSTLYPNFFLKIAFFPCDFLKFVFIEGPLDFSRSETFSEHRRLLMVFGTMRLIGDLHQKIFPKTFVFFTL